ncbi:MAG: phosphatase PAP2 family protein [Luteimonas sp.]
MKPDAVLKEEARFGAAFVRRHGWRLALLFGGVLLPLWGFAALAEDLHEGEPFAFDVPVLQMAHALARQGFDHLFLLFSAIGYQYGVVPFDVALVLVLAWKRRLREGLFAGGALGGSALLNIVAKQAFARERPTLWQSISPEDSFSFPSAHAMGSMTIAVVVILLAWPTRWRWIAVAAMSVFTVMVGLSRIYLGVHYPSDILAGWAAASIWAVGCYGLLFNGRLRPWQLQEETSS